jgi:hypothetical protein
MKWNKKYKLGIIGLYNKKNKFIFTTNNKRSLNAPLFKKGSITAIYTIKDPITGYNYILRLFNENTPTHMMDNPKIKDEYIRYKNYLIKIYFYGIIQTVDNNFIVNDKIEVLKDIKTYQFNHIITKVYNTPIVNDMGITNMTNLQKFDFIINNIKLLIDLEKNNEFHSDFKITNIGWDNKDTMDVILIDYDENTIKKISKDLYIKKDDKYELTFPSSYPPKYIGSEIKPGVYSFLYIKDISQFNKFSVSGLAQIINYLDVEFTDTLIKLPIKDEYHNIPNINTYSISSSLRLNDFLYENIPTYTQIYNIFIYLKDYLK